MRLCLDILVRLHAYIALQIIAELQYKAPSFQKTGILSALELDATVVKSDTAVAPELKEELKAACTPLEDVPTRSKDWHPGSDEKVLDLVHPSLFPLIYGRSRVLPSGGVGLRDCVEYIGQGVTIKLPEESNVEVDRSRPWYTSPRTHPKFWSQNFQWLPCDVVFAGQEDVKITSYINNLHPSQYPDLYSVVEKFIAKSIPLWDHTLTLKKAQWERNPRIEMEYTQYEFPEGEEGPEEVRDDYSAKEDWLRSTRVLVKPEVCLLRAFPVSLVSRLEFRYTF